MLPSWFHCHSFTLSNAFLSSTIRLLPFHYIGCRLHAFLREQIIIFTSSVGLSWSYYRKELWITTLIPLDHFHHCINICLPCLYSPRQHYQVTLPLLFFATTLNSEHWALLHYEANSITITLQTLSCWGMFLYLQQLALVPILAHCIVGFLY